ISSLFSFHCPPHTPPLPPFPTRRSSDLRQSPKPISAVEFVRAMETQQTSLIDRYFRQRHDPNARGANDRSLLFTAVLREDPIDRSEEHTSELQSRFDLVCRLLLEKKKTT